MRADRDVIRGDGFVMVSVWHNGGAPWPENIPACWWRFLAYKGPKDANGMPMGGRNIR